MISSLTFLTNTGKNSDDHVIFFGNSMVWATNTILKSNRRSKRALKLLLADTCYGAAP